MLYTEQYLNEIERKLRSTGVEIKGIFYGIDCAEVAFYDSFRYGTFCDYFDLASREEKEKLNQQIPQVKDEWIREVFVVELADKIGWKL